MYAAPQALLAFLLPLLIPQGLVQDPIVAQYHEAMASASVEGLPALVSKLDKLASSAPAAPITPRLHETIQAIAILHPGSVPDHAARLQALKSQASANPGIARILRRLELTQQYYAAAATGQSEKAAASLTDAVFEGSLMGIQALADASLRARDYGRAEALAQQIIESDPYSPLFANAYVILGLCDGYRGDVQGAARRFQRALAITPLPTVYGSTQDLLAGVYRFVRPTPGTVGEIFDDVNAARLAGIQGLKEPRSLVRHQGKFILIDKEQVLTISADGKVTDTKPGRKIEDLAITAEGKYYYLAEDGIDLGTGTFVPLSATVGGKAKALKKLRSLAVDGRGDLYILDQDAGLFSCSPGAGASPTLTAIIPTKGRLIRIDPRGNFYLLAEDQRSILVLTREGKTITTVSPASTTGKQPSIEYFALDTLNHIYILDSASIQIFAMNDASAGLDKAKISAIPLDPRPYFKNLRVLAVSATGEMAVTGKNEDNWVLFR
jgi:tetratricopeptide (TPR) repeat protein